MSFIPGITQWWAILLPVVYLGSFLTGCSVPDVALEPNDEKAQATQITPDYDNPNLWIADGDYDWFTFTLTERTMVSVHVKGYGERSTISGVVDLYDSLGNALDGSFWAGSDSPANFRTIQEPGTYFLFLFGSEYYIGKYHLSVSTAVAPSDDALEPNDSADQATAMSLNYVNTELMLLGDNRDWFTYTLTSRQLVSVRATAFYDYESFYGDSTFYGYVYHYDNLGNELEYGRWDSATSPAVILSIQEAGTYFLKVSGCSSCFVSYHLFVSTGEAPPDDSLEPNDSAEQATAISLDYESPELKTLDSNTDWFIYTLTTRRAVSIDVTSKIEDPTFEGSVVLYSNPTGYDEYEDWNSMNESPSIHVTQESGTYFVQVNGSSDYFGSYFLSVSTEEPPPAQ